MEIGSPFTMVVLIVLIAVAAGVINNYIKVRSETQSRAGEGHELDAMRDEVARLKERVRVLETLATDQDRQLHDEIRRLG